MELFFTNDLPPQMAYALVTIAAYLAGVLNAIAGGGSFLTFSALVIVGVPGVMANATSAMSVLPSYVGGALGFHNELAGFDRKALSRFCVIAMAGAFIGACLLLLTPPSLFDAVVPILLIIATLLFAFNKQLLGYIRGLERADPEKPIINPFLGLFIVSIYGGYFNGGLGILLLALFAVIGLNDIHMMNGLKLLLSFVLSLISVLTFSLSGLIEWNYALIMMIAATLGGYSGARWSKILPQQLVRQIIVVVGIVISGLFIYRLF